ncbi:MAG: FGGY-family carbohydrate kinase, partial [Bilifractor sp.]
MPGYLIAHDIGTSGDKATLYRTDGIALRSETISYPVHYFGHHCAEQDPEDWWQAVCRSTRKILEDIPASSVLGLSFSAQMQCCLPVDRDGHPLRPAMIWADHRAVEERDHLIRAIGFDRMYEITGHRPNESYTLEKVMWLKKHEPDIYARTYKVLQVKDYLLFRLTGRFATDYSDASGTNAMDLNRFAWSDDILKAAEISPDLFPELHASTDIIGPLIKEAATATGLPEGLPIVCGGGDGPCAAVGAGCIEDQQLYATFGTSAWIGGTTREKFVDDQKILMCFAHVIPGRYAPCGTMQAAGSSYAYIRSLLEPDTSYEELDREIATAPPGSDGLIFLPYLTGERSPR